MTNYCTTAELRQFMQFANTDIPNDTDMEFLLDQAKVDMDDDLAGDESSAVQKLLQLNLGTFYVLESLAARAIRKGYVEITVDGESIRMAFQELKDGAKNFKERYEEILAKSGTEAGITSPLRNLESDTQGDIIDMFHGTSNGVDYEDGITYSQERRRI